MALLALASLIWAFSFGLIKQHMTVLDPAFVAFARLALALLAFAPFFRPRGGLLPLRLRLIAVGAVQFGLMYLAYVAAFRLLHAYQVALLTLTTPVLVCLCTALIARRLSGLALAAAALSFFGAAVALNPHALGHAQWAGVAMVQFSNLCFAAGQVAYRHYKPRFAQTPYREDMAWLYLGAALATLPFAAAGAAPSIHQLTPERLGTLLYLGVIASGLGFYLWNRGATRVRSAELAVMNNAKTPLAVAVSLIVFGEQANLLRLCLGAGLMALASVLASRTAKD
jgi:drug/metabolite transporter (DMT)-like permease